MAPILSKNVSKSLYRNLLPAQMFSLAISGLNGILTSMIIGNFMGSDCLAVFGFITPLNCIHTLLGTGISAGAQILCGRFIGRGDNDSISDVYSAAMLFCILAGGILTVLYQFFPNAVAALLGASGESLKLTAGYLRGLSWGMIFQILSSSMIVFLQLDNAGFTMYLAIGVMTAGNIAGDLVDIFLVKGGMFGAGVAASISNVLFTLVVLIYYYSPKCGTKIKLRGFNGKIGKDIIVFGMPTFMMFIAMTFRNLIMNKVALGISGAAAMTALGVMGSMDALAAPFNRGGDYTVNIISSILYGERDKNSLRELLPTALSYDYPMHSGCYVIVFLFASMFARLFGVKGDLVPFVTTAIRLNLLYLLANDMFLLVTSIYRGIGRNGLINVAMILNYFVFPVFFCLTLPKVFGINGFWLSYVLPEVFVALILVLWASKKRGSLPKRMSEVIYIPEETGIGKRDRLDLTIRDEKDISSAAANAMSFCKSKGMSESLANSCSLCIEEMTAAILERGKKLELKKKEVDLRLIYENNGISMILRDNYPPFNPMEWGEINENEETIGVRMVIKMAKSVVYNTVLNLNVLTIRVEQ